jgi:RNA polymerase sigma-70 factor (ECF subfamily)
VLPELHNHTILQDIARGDEHAFSSLFNEYHQQLGSFVFSVIRSEALTEEIIQDIFVKVWEQRKALPGLKNFSAWLFILTRNHTLNAIRKISQARKNEEAILRHYALVENDEQTPADHYYTALDSAVEQLPLQQKKVLRLKLLGLKNAEIASQLDLSINTVKKYQQWALQAIARIIKTNTFIKLLFLISSLF